MASKKLKRKETSARISAALARSGRKAKEVAASLGVSEVTMSKYVNGVLILIYYILFYKHFKINIYALWQMKFMKTNFI